MPRWMKVTDWNTEQARIALGPDDGIDAVLAGDDPLALAWYHAADRAQLLELAGAREAVSARKTERKLWARLCRDVQDANGYRAELSLSPSTASTLPAVLRSIGGGR